MNNLLCLPLFVLILIFDSVNNSKTEKVSPAYLFTKKISWHDATEKCQMVGLDETVNISSPYSGLSWTNETARYSTWFEYLGCFDVLQKTIADSETMTEGTTLLACIERCKQYFFIGLQDKVCVCLHKIENNAGSINGHCSPEICINDDRAFCATVDLDQNTQHVTVYKKVSIKTRPGGECLIVQRFPKEPYIRFDALDCLTENFPTCLNSVNGDVLDSKNKIKKNWIDSFALCDESNSKLASFGQTLVNISSHVLDLNAKYWVSNTRRLIAQFPPVTNPEVCIAARVKQDGRLKGFPRRCDTQLPVLCIGHEVTPTKVSDDATPINKVLLISVIAAASLTLLVAIIIAVLCIRMKKLQPNSSQNQIVVDGKNIVYAQVDRSMNQDRTTNQTTGQSPVEDTYDHMDHSCLNHMPPKEESNYDTMSKVGIVEENDYSHTNETGRERQCFVDASSEYSHVTVVPKPKTIID